MKNWVFLVSVLLGFGLALQAKEKESKNVKVSAFWEYESVKPGMTNRIALKFKINKGWHVYWVNPGDSGTPVKIKWNLPEGFVLLPTELPAPKRSEAEGITSFVYEDELVILAEVIVPFSAPVGKNPRISADVEWLECSDMCVPGSAEIKTSFAVKETEKLNPGVKKIFAEASKKIPTLKTAWKASISVKGKTVQLNLHSATLTLPEGSVISAFPRDGETFSPAVKIVSQKQHELVLEFQKQAISKESVHVFRALVSSSLGWGSPSVSDSLVIEEEVKTAGGFNLLLILFYAFLGGLILNLMPCVFPVISLKMMSFVRQSGGNPALIRNQGLFYFLGVVLSFLAIAGVLLALKQGGQSLGWGFQLQTPLFVGLMVFLMFAVGLNLAGLFEMGTALTGVGGELLSRRGNIGAALNGSLAVLIATPCTGPFMGAALGFALAQPVEIALLVFLFLGIGMGAPYLLFSFFPKLLSFLPKPGAWMIVFKQVMSFPMFATAVWLIWVFGNQKGVNGESFLIAGLVPLSVGFWILGKWDLPHLSVTSRWVSKFFFILFLTLSFWFLWKGSKENVSVETITTSAIWQKFDPLVISEMEKNHQAYFINFTALWCLTCQVNKKVALETSATEKAFRVRGIKTFKADWTDYNPQISKALAKWNRGGIPVYVFYSGLEGSEPTLLPEVLTEGIVLDAIKIVPIRGN